MPGTTFFEHLGLFVINDFLEPALCQEVCSEMRGSISEQAGVILETGELQINQGIRKVLRSKVSSSVNVRIQEKLEHIRPQLELHFAVRLQRDPKPDFLMYGPGSFYSVHTDLGSSGDNRRRVSVTIFLNSGYSGGELMLGGLINGAKWERCLFPLDSHEGLLIAFPSRLMHEVKPITKGQRFTVVAWFLAA